MKVTEKKLADGVIKLDCEATAIEVNNALKEAAEAFAMQMGVRPAPGKSIEELAKEQLGISDLVKIVEPNAIEVLVPRVLDRRNLVPAFPAQGHAHGEVRAGKKFTFTLNAREAHLRAHLLRAGGDHGAPLRLRRDSHQPAVGGDCQELRHLCRGRRQAACGGGRLLHCHEVLRRRRGDQGAHL
ncbi:MAG: hypothetical protein ACLUE1_08505 [Adlercreutzia equolifaciens]